MITFIKNWQKAAYSIVVQYSLFASVYGWHSLTIECPENPVKCNSTNFWDKNVVCAFLVLMTTINSFRSKLRFLKGSYSITGSCVK